MNNYIYKDTQKRDLVSDTEEIDKFKEKNKTDIEIKEDIYSKNKY
jgi:hypothetical protein